MSESICICGHNRSEHHNHRDYAWGTYSICSRCTKCDWDSFECYQFIERKGIICPECKEDRIMRNVPSSLFDYKKDWNMYCWKCKKHLKTPKKYKKEKYRID